jgi:hypothetical protein
MNMKKIIAMLCLVAITTGSIFAQKGYEKSIELGASVGVGDYSNNTFGISMINGYRFSQYLFAGAGVGFGYSNALNGVSIKDGITTEYRTDAYLIPIFANVKANLSAGKVSPFIQLNAGYTFDVNQYLKDAPGFMVEPAFGVDFKMNDKKAFYLIAGFNLQHSKYSFNRNVGTTTDDWDISIKSEMLKAISLMAGFKF